MAEHEMDHTEEDLELNPLERLRKSFHDEINELVKLELDVEELAERKAGIIKAYLKEDMHGIRDYWEGLKAETNALEDYLGQWLLQAANPTAVDWAKLRQFIAKGEDQLLAGDEVEDVELVCTGCGKMRIIEGKATLESCSSCGCELYRYRQ